ncbi:MAG: ParD-like family protein [Alphaproteobacteria bacterium]|nr:ParD-like family protein [Alphaproteobacteria bacterium]
MGSAVKLSDTTISALRDAAHVHSRSMSGQAEYWIKLGRAVEHDPSFNLSRIDRALRGIEPVALDGLSRQELDLLFLGMAQAGPTPQEEAFWRDRRERGLGVGLDDDGNLIYGANAVKPVTP